MNLKIKKKKKKKTNFENSNTVENIINSDIDLINNKIDQSEYESKNIN